MTNEPAPGQLTVHAWLDRVRAACAFEPHQELTAAERRLLLELARLAARTSDRVAAPLSTYLIGMAVAGLTPVARTERLEAIVRTLEEEPG